MPGRPQAGLDTQNFLALNVQNSPGNYTNLPRPIPAADASETTSTWRRHR